MRTTGDDGRLGAILEGEAAAGLGSAELLGRFAATRDESAFAALVARHGPMVLATCRRILPAGADADDAFQATFLVLARRAGSVGDPERLAPWLHGVARRVAGRARAVADRRRRAEGSAAKAGDEVAPGVPAEAVELRSVLDEELARLPEKYRAPLVLCYLDGLTSDEAARQLAWPVGTVRSRLAGGRDRLRSRLARRGYAPGALAIPPPATWPSSAVSPILQAAAVRLALAPAMGRSAGAAGLIAQGVLTSMTLAKIQATALAVLATAALAAGVGAAQQPAGPGPSPAPTSTPAAAPAAPGTPGDPSVFLPPDSENYGRAVERLQALEGSLAAIRRSIEPVRMVPKDGGFTPERPVPADNVLAIERLQTLEAELAAIRQSIEPVPLLPKGDGFVPARVEPGQPIPFLVRLPKPDPAPAADADRLRALLREAEARAQVYASNQGGDGPGAQLKLERAVIEVGALRRRLVQAGISQAPELAPKALALHLHGLDKAERDVTAPPTPELAGDDRYALDLADLRERARAEVAALQAKLPPDPAPTPGEPASGATRPEQGADETARLIARVMPWQLDPPAGREGDDPARATGYARVRAVAATIKQLQRLLFAPPVGANLALNQTFERLALWSGRLTDAQLDVAEGRDARVAALADGLKRAQDLERLARDLVAGESNGLSEVDIAIAAYARADAEARFRREQGRPADAPAGPDPKPATVPGAAPGRAPDAKVSASPGPQSMPAPEADGPGRPTVRPIGQTGLLMAISADLDLVTMISPRTGKRATLRLAKPATAIEPKWMQGGGVGPVGLMLEGPEITQLAVFDPAQMRWLEHPLKVPVTRADPVINNAQTWMTYALRGAKIGEAPAFDLRSREWRPDALAGPPQAQVASIVASDGTKVTQAGPFYYFSNMARAKVVVFEVKRPSPPGRLGETTFGDMTALGMLVVRGVTALNDGTLCVQDGDVLNVYHPKDDELTRIDLAGEK